MFVEFFKIKRQVFFENAQGVSNRWSDEGGVVFAVCRGKLAEGVQLNKKGLNLVLVVGLPYAGIGELRVRLKKDSITRRRDNLVSTIVSQMTPAQWYQQDCERAVNQAIGRVIRHKHDFGAIVLIDSRYSTKFGLSKWMMSQVKSYSDDFEAFSSELNKFFMQNESEEPALAKPEIDYQQKFKLFIQENPDIFRGQESEELEHQQKRLALHIQGIQSETAALPSLLDQDMRPTVDIKRQRTEYFEKHVMQFSDQTLNAKLQIEQGRSLTRYDNQMAEDQFFAESLDFDKEEPISVQRQSNQERLKKPERKYKRKYGQKKDDIF